MDIIDKIVKRLHNKIIAFRNHTTLKKILTVYIIIAVVAAFLSSVVLICFFENWKTIVFNLHSIGKITWLDQVEYERITNLLPEAIRKQILILNILEIVSVVACVITAVIGVSHLYYKRVLEEPIKIFQTEMQYLGRDDLSFDCSYVSGDEMGEICQIFNRMRLQLLENKKNNWELMESQRELNAAFAHDIRTPLTVMKGYIQMILNYYPTGMITEEKMLETLQMLDRQVNRMERFSATMKEINTMEEWQIIHKSQTLQALYQKIMNNCAGMSSDNIQISLQELEQGDKIIVCDDNLIQEVVDNLVMNARRYAQKKIQITMKAEEEKLYFYVKDDGIGFTKEALEKATRPYFSTNEEHYGLGLTICQILCKKHGGNLEIMNSIDGGAVTCAYFYIR